MNEIEARRRRDITEAGERFQLGPIEAVAPVEDSVLNDNYRVTSESGTWFVRFIQKKRARVIVEAEHRALRHLDASGVPVPLARGTPAGESVLSVGGTLVAVFPFIAGRTAPHGSMTAAEAAAIGDVHGRTVKALADYHDLVLETRPAGEVDWDTSRSIAELSRVDDLIRYYPAPPADQLEAQAVLRTQLTLLESSEARPAEDFTDLPSQLEHGDFHERNVIFSDAGNVAAVVDWERIRRLPRAFQLVRALDFSGLLEPGRVEPYVSAYREHVQLEPGEASLAVEQWWQSTIHNTWVFTEVFIRGDARVRRFLPQIAPRLERLGRVEFRSEVARRIEASATRTEPRGD